MLDSLVLIKTIEIVSNQVNVVVERVKTSSKGGYIVTINEKLDTPGEVIKTGLGGQAKSEFGQSWSTKVISDPPAKDDEVTIDLDMYDQVPNEFVVDDPKSKNHGKKMTKMWLFLK